MNPIEIYKSDHAHFKNRMTYKIDQLKNHHKKGTTINLIKPKKNP